MDSDVDRFTRLMAGLNGAMAVVTTVAESGRAGCLVGFHCQCSIEPPRYAVWLSKSNHTYRTAIHATHLAVHFIGPQHRTLAELFGGTTGDDIDKFERCSVATGPGGVPLLVDCPNRFVGRRLTALDDGGDHVCFVLDPVHADVGDVTPLRLHDVEDITAGHEADDRAE